MGEIYLGKPHQKIVAWCKAHYGPKNVPLYFEAKTANCTVALMKQGSPDTITIKTSTDGLTWSENAYVFGSDITLANVGDKVYFKQVGGSGKFSKSYSAYYYFKLNNGGTTGEVECHGNVMSLVDETLEKKTIENNYLFCYLFKNYKVIKSAPALPATTLTTRCYYYMFSNCTSLTQAPELPATTLAIGCYANMFDGCTKLSSIEVNFSAWNPTNATFEWVKNIGTQVSGEKIFTCPSALPQARGYNYIPDDWTIVTK